MQEPLILYNYFRSSASYRVRIALHLKGMIFEYRPVHLIKNGGEQFRSTYQDLNPQSQVPCLIHKGRPIAQSMAIMLYLDDLQPSPLLFPRDSYTRALVVQFCEVINSGVQPLQNLIVLKNLETEFGADQSQKDQWIIHWNKHYLASLEKILMKHSGQYCFGDQITAADCFLVPQVFSAKRFKVDLSPYTNIQRIYQTLNQLEPFKKAAPENQPDFE